MRANPPGQERNALAAQVAQHIAFLLCGQSVPIDRVAAALGMSRRSLQRGLAAHGLRYSQLLAEVRTERAARWLIDSDRAVVEIALDLGYTDAANFTRAFRRQTGMSPQAFRRHWRSRPAAPAHRPLRSDFRPARLPDASR